MLDIHLGNLDMCKQASRSRHPQQILMLDICLDAKHQPGRPKRVKPSVSLETSSRPGYVKASILLERSSEF
eukprot:9341442-Pyramimonas_sp.AAC.1